MAGFGFFDSDFSREKKLMVLAHLYLHSTICQYGNQNLHTLWKQQFHAFTLLQETWLVRRFTANWPYERPLDKTEKQSNSCCFRQGSEWPHWMWHLTDSGKL